MRRLAVLVGTLTLTVGTLAGQPAIASDEVPDSHAVAVQARGVAAATGGDDWRGQNLRDRDLRRAEAPGGDHRNADLRGATLHHAVLHHARFHGADLRAANLHHADLRYSIFHGADLSKAILDRARLHYADLGKSRDHHATLFKASLKGASLRHATAHRVDLRKAAMQRVDLQGARMHNARLTGAVMHRARLDDVDAKGADLRSITARRATFNRAVMRDATFASAHLPNARFRKADLAGADFSARDAGRSAAASLLPACGGRCTGADLSGSDFTGADLTGVDFSGADLSNVVMRTANLTNANFTGADLRNADLTGATWTGAVFAGAITQGTSFGTQAGPVTGTHAKFCTSSHVPTTTQTSVADGLVLASYTQMSSSGTGTAVLVGPDGLYVDVSFACDLHNGTTSGSFPSLRTTYPFTLTVTGTHGAYTSPLTGLSVDSRAFSGSVSRAKDGSVSWNITSTATYTFQGITLTGAFTVVSSRDWSVSVNGGSGSVVTSDGSFTLNSFSGSITYGSGQLSGQVVMQASGTHSWFAALPSSWTKSAALELDLRGSATNIVVQPSLELTATSSAGGNQSTITMTGQLGSTGSNWSSRGIRMTGGGEVYIQDVAVSVNGWYQSSGYQAQVAPSWDLDGSFTTPVALGNGASVVSGSIEITSGTAGITGTVSVSIESGAGQAFSATMDYQDAENWTLTATGGGTSTWSPMSGLTIPAQAFSGTVSVTNGVTAWAVDIGSSGSPLTWSSVANGVSLQAWYSLSTTCPVSSCDGAGDGLFLASHDGLISFTHPSFSAATSGVLLADGSWATFTASGLGTQTFKGPNGGTVSLGDASLTLWEGDAPHSPVNGLTMPDINNSGSGIGVEFCGSFAATDVPYVGTTQPAQGCASWAPGSVVIGVTNLGVSMPGGAATAYGDDSVNGVNISGGSINGLAWTNRFNQPVVTIAGTTLTLAPQTTTLSGTVTLPGDVMAALGKPMKPMPIPATATFSDPSWTTEDASFDMTAEVPLNYSSNGFTLKHLFIDVSKTGPQFAFTVGVDATYRINNVPAPVTMSLGYQDAALALKLNATGTGADSDACACDGVNGQFTTPEEYTYLTDSFMQVPGMHLWSITGQLIVSKGEPGFGIGATVYQDPRQLPLILQGSTWLQAKFYANADLLDPCLDFGFTSSDPGTYLQVKDGVLETTSFDISVAPAAGCTVGNDDITGGINVAFTSSFGGQGSFDVELAFDPAAGSFYEQIDIANVSFGGIDFEDGELTIDLSPTQEQVSFDTDFTLPPSGTFSSVFDVSVSSSDMMFNGAVSMTDWDMAGGTFDVQSLSFQMNFDTGQGTFSSTATGKMKFSKKTNIAFTADIEYNNDALQEFDFDFDYTHGSSGWDYTLDYSAATNSLSGGISLDYVKETSHRFCSACHKYVRHAYMTVWLDYWMNTANPSQATLSIGLNGSSSDGDLQITGGATLSSVNEGDDSAWASLHVHISGAGSWDDSWTW